MWGQAFLGRGKAGGRQRGNRAGGEQREDSLIDRGTQREESRSGRYARSNPPSLDRAIQIRGSSAHLDLRLWIIAGQESSVPYLV